MNPRITYTADWIGGAFFAIAGLAVSELPAETAEAAACIQSAGYMLALAGLGLITLGLSQWKHEHQHQSPHAPPAKRKQSLDK